MPTVDQVLSTTSFTERNAAYRVAATELASRTSADALKAASDAPS